MELVAELGQLLIKHGADVNALTKTKQSPIQVALLNQPFRGGQKPIAP